jgi:predicted alpha/beta superfamily hydrolase
MATPTQIPNPERYVVAFVIQGEDVFKITADNILHTCGNAGEFAFQGIAKLRAAAALEQLTAIHNERPEELRKMAREMAREGMTLLARTSNGTRPNVEKIA